MLRARHSEPKLPYRTIHDTHVHHVWDRSISPIETVAPGQSLTFLVQDASAGQITPRSGPGVFAEYDGKRVNPVTGPIFVDGAEPGDTLAVKLESYRPSGWGWTANIPGFGLLADQFPDAALHHWHYDVTGKEPLLFGSIAQVPLAPFTGTAGVAPAEPGPHSIIPPRRTGGNMDIRDLVAGSALYLPVEVAGALFSIGDTHAAQGDGEVCGTAIESPMEVSLTLDLIKGEAAAFPRLEAHGHPRCNDGETIDVTTGIGPDLMRAARDAVSGMIDLLGKRRKLSAIDAYMLCSVAGDLRISQVVDAPNWTVSFHMPRGIFGE
jgi:acetamidase/formamidase